MGYQKSKKKNRNLAVSGKGDLTGKTTMFGGFSQNDPLKSGNFSVHVIRSFLPDQFVTSHIISEFEFFAKNVQGVTLWLLNHDFLCKKRRGNNPFDRVPKFLLTGFQFNFSTAWLHTFARADPITGRGIFKNTFLIGSWHCVAAFFLQVPKLCTDLDRNLLYILILRTHTKFVWENKMSALGVCLSQPCSSTGRRFAASKSLLYYYRRIVSFSQ